MCGDMSACEQDRMCTDTTACALGLGTVCEACFQEPCVHPQMLSLFKDLGQVVQELCASHSPEGTEAGEASEEEAATMTAVVAKELKDLMEKQGLNIRMLAEQIQRAQRNSHHDDCRGRELEDRSSGTAAEVERVYRGGTGRQDRVREVL